MKRLLSILMLFFLSSLMSIGENSSIYNDGSARVRIGDVAPDIELPSPSGKVLKLSSLRGKIVLIDFWASWCGPCRRENPNVVRAYNKYRKAKFKDAKGFEVFSVSLDANHKSWVSAIKQDGLVWKYHVSDLKKWRSSAAKLYGVGSIPSSYLIDRNGIVIAKNLRGPMIDQQMDALIKEL